MGNKLTRDSGDEHSTDEPEERCEEFGDPSPFPTDEAIPRDDQELKRSITGDIWAGLWLGAIIEFGCLHLRSGYITGDSIVEQASSPGCNILVIHHEVEKWVVNLV